MLGHIFQIGLAVTIFISGQTLVAKDAAKDSFRVPKSTIEALERKIQGEKDPARRVQLVLRWVKNKEDFEQSLLEKKLSASKKASESVQETSSNPMAGVELFAEYKKVIVDRLESELVVLAGQPPGVLDPLFHVLGFRLLEVQRHKDAVTIFEKISAKSSEDYMGLGDAYFAAGNTRAALDAFEHGALDAKFRNTAAYKRAWCFLQLSDFQNALKEFDGALEDNTFSTVKLKEEAYRDRLRPYIETYTKSTFDEEELRKLKVLASKVYPDSAEKAKALTISGLKTLIEVFNAKAQVERAQQVFAFLQTEVDDATAVLFMSAPLWIKIYRGQLRHDQVEKIIVSLPTKKPKDVDAAALQSELYNSVVFYDTLYKEDSEQATRRLLFMMSKKFFELFPDDPNADPLRVTYSKLLLEDGDPAECIEILARRKGGEREIEDMALSLDAKCELKQLDQLYQKEHDEFFYAKLKKNILEKKVYERNDLGLSSEAAFESLARMLIGSLSKSPKNAYLRDMLAQLLQSYPYGKDKRLYTDLQIQLSELTFQDLLDSKDAPDDRANLFFKVFQSAPRWADVAKKSLINSIVIGRAAKTLNHCETFFQTYGEDFVPGKEVFERCIRLAEQHLDLEKEYLFWMQVENKFGEAQQIKVGLLELALEKARGRKRIEKVKTPQAKAALELWDGSGRVREKERDSARLTKLLENGKAFLAALKPIPFAKIRTVVPGKIKEFEAIDSQAVSLYKAKPAPLEMAKALEFRAQIAAKMRNWIKALPEPSGLTPEELSQYRSKAQEVSKVWEEGAQKRAQECAELAHGLSIDYKVSDLSVCPDQTPEATYTRYLDKWQSTRQSQPQLAPWSGEEVLEKGETVTFLLDAGAKAKNPEKAKYFLIRALDLSATDYEKGRVYLALAKLVNKDVFWESAASADGNLPEPLAWWRKQATGNPFFEKLYDRMIAEVKPR